MLESNSLTAQMSQAETAAEGRESLRAHCSHTPLGFTRSPHNGTVSPSISWDDSRAVMLTLLAAFSTLENT